MILKYLVLCSLFCIYDQTSVESILKAIESKIDEKCPKDYSSTIFSLSSSIISNGNLENNKPYLACAIEHARKNPLSGSILLLVASLLVSNPIGLKTSEWHRDLSQEASLILGSGQGFENMKNWHFLGPFPIGTSEIDGDPALSKAKNVYRLIRQYGERPPVKILSELSSNGAFSWQQVTARNTDGLVQLMPQVDWRSIVQALGSTAATEWQGWLVGHFFVWPDNSSKKNKNVGLDNLQINCEGVAAYEVDGALLAGDLYHRGDLWTPLPSSTLARYGIHTVAMRVRGKQGAVVNCRLRRIKPSTTQTLLPAQFLPDFWNGQLPSGSAPLTMRIVNSGESPLVACSLRFVKASPELRLQLLPGDEGRKVLPGQLGSVRALLTAKRADHTIECHGDAYEVKVKVVCQSGLNVGDANSAMQRLTFRCRRPEQSFLFTFVARDGSVQRAAAIKPRGQRCPTRSEEGKEVEVCSTLLTLHGTSISPQDQADSYKHVPPNAASGMYVFGLQSAWVLAPSRHGAHNWEGPGTATALDALAALAKLTRSMPDLRHKSSEKNVIFAGHSMGGHGALHMATHYPDMALAVLPLAGWIRKEDYGDSNAFFRHDVATSSASPEIKSVLEATVAENYADMHLPNIAGVPIFARAGKIDQTVHPVFLRRVVRIMRENADDGNEIEHVELEGKDHWWWDTKHANDGGAVNDDVLREFMEKHASRDVGVEGSCRVGVGGDCRGQSQGNHYSEDSSRMSHTSKKLLCVNPRSCGTSAGVRLLRQLVPHRVSELQIFIDEKSMQISTKNVLELSIDQKMLDNRKLLVNKQITRVSRGSDDAPNQIPTEALCFSRLQNGAGTVGTAVWKLCFEVPVSPHQRSVQQLGGAAQIGFRPLAIVHGEGVELQQLALYIANQFQLTSDLPTEVYTEQQWSAHPDRALNVVLLARTSKSGLARDYLSALPSLRVTNITIDGQTKSGFTLTDNEECFCHRNGDCALLTLAPNGEKNLALLLLAESSESLKFLAHFATPTIPPMARQPFTNQLPDFVLASAAEGVARGAGGYFCTGFWDHMTWTYRRDSASCVC